MVQASGAEAGLHAAEHETDGRDEPSRGGVRAVERAVRILRAFTPERPWLTLAEIAEAAPSPQWLYMQATLHQTEQPLQALTLCWREPTLRTLRK